MFWNKKDEPFVVGQDFNYPKVLIKAPNKDIEGYAEVADLDFLRNRDRMFVVRVQGNLIGVSIKEVEANDWYMKVVHEGETLYETQPNLLEIKLKDTDSVPEVWYKGERLDNALVDISYHWRTNDILNDDNGANDINIEYYSTLDGKYIDKKIIGHKRDA